MVVILVLMTFVGAVLINVLWTHFVRRREVSRASLEMAVSPAVAASGSGRIPQFPGNIYYHNGHAWIRLDENNSIRIGLDDFTQQVMGDIDEIEIPPVGSKLNQGEVAWRLRRGERKLSQLAPLGGTVVEINEKLRQDPSLANRSPYEKGWILKIQPKAFNDEMPKLMDSFQFRVYFDQLKAKMMSIINHQSLGIVYGDGGEVVKGAAAQLEEKYWRLLVAQLFRSSPE